jgi:hypothetical protein
MGEAYPLQREAGGHSRRRRLRITRFLRLYAITLLASAFVVGCVATLQFMFSSGPGLRHHASQFVFHDGLRRTSTLANAIALAAALVLWAARQPPDRLRRRRGRVLRQALAVAIPGYLIGSGVVISIGLTILVSLFALPVTILPFGAQAVTRWDFSIGVQSTVLDAALLVALSRLFLARWTAFRVELRFKLLGAIGVALGAHFWLFQFTSS